MTVVADEADEANVEPWKRARQVIKKLSEAGGVGRARATNSALSL